MATELIMKLEDKEYRDAFVASQINIELPFQVRALREKRGWTQSELAKRTKMAQPRISTIETPGKGTLNLETLLRLASAFDVGLSVRFASFKELVEWADRFSPDTFQVLSFENDTLGQEEKIPTGGTQKEEKIAPSTINRSSQLDNRELESPSNPSSEENFWEVPNPSPSSQSRFISKGTPLGRPFYQDKARLLAA